MSAELLSLSTSNVLLLPARLAVEIGTLTPEEHRI